MSFYIFCVFLCALYLTAIQMGRPSKICGTDSAAGGCMTSPSHLQQAGRGGGLHLPGGYLLSGALPHAPWRPGEDRLNTAVSGLAHHPDWTTLDQRRLGDAWNSPQYSDSTGTQRARVVENVVLKCFKSIFLLFQPSRTAEVM